MLAQQLAGEEAAVAAADHRYAPAVRNACAADTANIFLSYQEALKTLPYIQRIPQTPLVPTPLDTDSVL